MVASKVKCGKRLLYISEIGEIIVRRASASNFIRMVTNMKACGPWIKNTDRAPIGDKKTPSYAESTPAIGSKIKSTVEVPFSLKTEIDTMVIGSMACHKEKAV